VVLVFTVQIHRINGSKKLSKRFINLSEFFVLIFNKILKNIYNIDWRWIFHHKAKFFWYLIIEAFDEFCQSFGTPS